MALALTTCGGLAGSLWTGALAADSGALDSVSIQIEAPAELSGAASRLASWQPNRLSGFLALVGLSEEMIERPMPIRVLLVDEESAVELGAPRWVAGYARGEAATIVLFPARVPAYPYRSLEELLGHEVAHVLIFRASGGGHLPRWFHEGLAMLAEQAWGFDDRSRVALAVLRHGRYDLEDLDRRFGDPEQVKRAYALAGAFVRYLVELYGREFPATLLASVAGGEPFAEAFVTATGQDLRSAERSFWRRFTFWYRWLPFLTSSTALWLLIVGLALVAGRRRRQRAKVLERYWELEEALRLERDRLESRTEDDDLGPVN